MNLIVDNDSSVLDWTIAGPASQSILPPSTPSTPRILTMQLIKKDEVALPPRSAFPALSEVNQAGFLRCELQFYLDQLSATGAKFPKFPEEPF